MPTEKKTGNLIENQQAPSTIFADFEFTYVDEQQTNELQKEIVAKEPLIFKTGGQISEVITQNVSNFFEEIAKRIQQKENYSDRVDSKTSVYVLEIPEIALKGLSLILQSHEKRMIFMRELAEILDDGVIEVSEKESRRGARVRIMDDKDRIKTKILRIEEIPTSSDASEKMASKIAQYYSLENRKIVENAVAATMGEFITGNLVYESAETEKRRNEAQNLVKPVRVDVKLGGIVIEKGSVVDKNSLLKYQTYVKEKEKIANTRKFWSKVFNSASLCFILMVLTGVYMYHIHPEVVRSSKLVGVVSAVVIINIILNALVIRGFNLLSPVLNISPQLLPTIIPLALCSVILSTLIGLRVALYAGLFVSLVTAIQMENSFNVILNGMIISIISGFTVRYAKNYRDYFIKCVLVVSLTMPVMDFIRLVSYEQSIELIGRAVATGVVSGLLIAVLCVGVLFFIETTFRINSDMSLLTFCDYNNPLLKRLQIEAPGTYHHSLMVSSLAEHAARDIGANSIKARVCALFHDIGKLAKPEYFTENNIDGYNRHEDLSPRMSSIVILNHVKEGLELAMKYKLPKIICDTIEQHHGKDVISFFYQRAVDENEDKAENVHKGDYKYPGPLPREKETVITALADPCEAASRSLEKPTPSKIDALIGEIFRKKIRDGQLDDAEISVRELAIVRKSFMKTIATMMHGRIAYPKEDDDDDEETDLFKGTMRKDSEKE
jgi:putative nucleotidyltransferase with HDIG domain